MTYNYVELIIIIIAVILSCCTCTCCIAYCCRKARHTPRANPIAPAGPRPRIVSSTEEFEEAYRQGMDSRTVRSNNSGSTLPDVPGSPPIQSKFIIMIPRPPRRKKIVDVNSGHTAQVETGKPIDSSDLPPPSSPQIEPPAQLEEREGSSEDFDDDSELKEEEYETKGNSQLELVRPLISTVHPPKPPRDIDESNGNIQNDSEEEYSASSNSTSLHRPPSPHGLAPPSTFSKPSTATIPSTEYTKDNQSSILGDNLFE